MRAIRTILLTIAVLACRESVGVGDNGGGPLPLPLVDRIVYRAAASDAHSDIVTARLDGSEAVTLTGETTRDYCPSLSPDGMSIAWLRWEVYQTGSAPRLMLMRADGSEQKATVLLPLGASGCPVWSADSEMVAVAEWGFGSPKSGPLPNTVHVLRADGSEVATFPAYEVRSPSFSPDGTMLAHGTSDRSGSPYNFVVVVHRIDGSAGRSVVAGMLPAWAPSGEQIVYVCQAVCTGSFIPFPCVGLCIVNLDGTDARQISEEPINHEPVFSHDGSRIAFACPATTTDLCIADANGTRTLRVPLVPAGSVRASPRWSSDDRLLAFECRLANETHSDICAFDVNTGTFTRLTGRPGTHDTPTISPVGQR